MDASRERIRQAYDPVVLEQATTRLARLLGDHLKHVTAGEGPVLNWAAPEQNIAAAASWINDSVARPTESIVDRFEILLREMLSHGHNLHHPHYVGHQVPAPVPLAGLFDAVGAVTNQVMAVYEMSPWATATELALVRRLASYLNWSEGSYAGYVTHGATIANMNALLAARNLAVSGCWEAGLANRASEPVLVVQADAHYSIARSAGILGLGTGQVIKVPLDERRRMDPRQLELILDSLRVQQRPIVAVVACACSTSIGAFDPLDAIADVCERHQVWLHVDAAHGGSALLSPRHRDLVHGIERADSVVWDAHKMMFVPALCAFLFFKDRRTSYAAFQQNAPYLFDPTAPGLADYDLGLRTVECTKRAATFGLWGIWSLFGPQLFADLVDVTFDLGQQFYARLCSTTDFEPLHKPECNIVTFRHVPAALRDADPQTLALFQRQVRRAVIESGAFYLVATQIHGIEALRVTLINPLTTVQDLEQLLETVRRTGERFLSK